MGRIDTKPLLDLQMRHAMAASAEIAARTMADAGLTETDRFDVATQRLFYNADCKFWNQCGPVVAQTSDFDFPGPYGPIPVHLHRPDETTPAPC